MALVVTLPISALMIAVLQTKQASPISIDDQIAINRQRMHATNRANFNELLEEFDSNPKSRDAQDNQNAEILFDLGWIVLDKLEQGQSTEEVFEFFFDNLSEELQDLMMQLLQGFGYIDNLAGQPNTSTRGWHNTHIVFAMDIGYATGTLMSWLVGFVVGQILAFYGVSFGIVGLIGSAILGGIIGAWVEGWLNQVVYNWMGRIPGFRHVLFTVGVWWFWGSSDTDINILELLQYIVGGIGGKMGHGAMPSYVTAPKFA
jgi:hypothetical protein